MDKDDLPTDDELNMPDDLSAAKAELESTLPNWWYVIEGETDEHYRVALGNPDDADDVRVCDIPKPISMADALREAMKRALG